MRGLRIGFATMEPERGAVNYQRLSPDKETRSWPQ